MLKTTAARRLLFALTLPLCGSLVGCSSQPAPTLKVVGAEVTERTQDGLVVLFTVEAENASGQEVPLRDVEYTVSLHGKPLFSGTRSAQATVRRYGVQDFQLPAAIPAAHAQQLSGMVPYTIEGTVTYVVPGVLAKAMFDMDVIRPETGFAGRGVVEVK
ncbi:MAG TPA: LEA type 2 family protein [Phycisphaerales bacterium]|nr:LEA type 2 family protein [Phycisphaerales bacterium]